MRVKTSIERLPWPTPKPQKKKKKKKNGNNYLKPYNCVWIVLETFKNMQIYVNYL